MKCIDRFRFMAVVEMLQFKLELVERVSIEQLAQFRFAEELA